MTVDTRAHITSCTLQRRAVLRRFASYTDGPNHRVEQLAVQGHNGDEIRVTLEDLGAALRALKVRPADLGYAAPRKTKP